jgi:hypothetical protein
MRIFSQRFAYTQHAQKCLKNVEVEVEEDDDNNDSEKYSSEMDTRSNLSSEYENDKVEVIMLFQIILFELLRKAQIILTHLAYNFRWMMIMMYKTCHLTVLEMRYQR